MDRRALLLGALGAALGESRAAAAGIRPFDRAAFAAAQAADQPIVVFVHAAW